MLGHRRAAGGGDPAARTIDSGIPHAPIEATKLIDRRIDHVFFRPGQPGLQVTVGSATLAGDAVDGVFPSDHRAVVCDLSWTGR